MSDSENKNIDQELDGLDPSRRAFLRKVVLTTAFAVPIVSSFSIDGMLVSRALADTCPTNSAYPINSIYCLNQQ
jgi:hypothetical protein